MGTRGRGSLPVLRAPRGPGTAKRAILRDVLRARDEGAGFSRLKTIFIYFHAGD